MRWVLKMFEPQPNTRSEEAEPRLLWWRCLCAGVGFFMMVAVVQSYADVVRWGSLAGASNHFALQLVNGLTVGLAIGCIVDLVRWCRWKQRP